MKSVIILSILWLATSSGVEQEWRVELLSPKGFRFSIQHATGIERATISGRIFEASKPDTSGEEYESDLTLENNGWWTYQNLTASINPGDTTTFAVVNRFQVDPENDLDDFVLNEYTIPENATRVPA